MKPFELYKAARDALSHNKTVVVRGYVETYGFDFTLKDLEEHFMVTPHRPVQAHGKFWVGPNLSFFTAIFRYG